MSDDIALVLIKRIEALEEQVAELRKPEPRAWDDWYRAMTQHQPAPLEWPAIDLDAVTAELFTGKGEK